MPTVTASNDVASGGFVATAPSTPRQRIASLDVVRGAVMVLMALDHVRWYLSDFRGDPTNLANASVAIFLTRWVTHFCAPAFVFLAGTGTFLHGRRTESRAALSRFLLARGLWLVVIELTVMRLGWTFNLDFSHYLLGGVIWMIGWCLVGLAALVWLPMGAIALIGLALVAGHNVLNGFAPTILSKLQTSEWRWFWQILYYGGPVSIGGGPTLAILFSIVPWVGVMALGYAFGSILTLDAARRRRLSLGIGLASIAAFLVLREINLYGDPRPWTPQASPMLTVLAFVNTQKYPASLLYLLMTLGPTIALLPLIERARGRIVDAVATIGRVPFFYYVLHIPLIHGIAIALSLAHFGVIVPWLTANQPMAAGPPPPGYGYSLPVVYLVTALVVAALYFPCRWFAGVKSRRRAAWLSFL